MLKYPSPTLHTSNLGLYMEYEKTFSHFCCVLHAEDDPSLSSMIRDV